MLLYLLCLMCATVQLLWPGLFVSRGQGYCGRVTVAQFSSVPSDKPRRPFEWFHHIFHFATRKSWGYFRELTTLTCAWSSSMPAAIIASPASRYEGSTWRQIPLEVSLVRRVSLIFSIFIKEPLGQSSTPGPLRSLCSCEPKCCQLEDPDAVCLCQPALCHDHLSALCLDDQTWFLFISS